MTNLKKLLLNASGSLCTHAPELSGQLHNSAGMLIDDLLAMLQYRNGFYAFEGALHVFPTHSEEREMGLESWNDNGLWRSAYAELVDGCLFFAEDIFGGQFCIKGNKIYTFEPETGTLDYLADDIDTWAQVVLDDYEVLTGYPLAHQWQKLNGQLPPQTRLLPKIPFVVGGEFVLDNMRLSNSVEGMKFRADIANQIKDLPNGTRISLNITD